jgi:hypothetical protein
MNVESVFLGPPKKLEVQGNPVEATVATDAAQLSVAGAHDAPSARLEP